MTCLCLYWIQLAQSNTSSGNGGFVCACIALLVVLAGVAAAMQKTRCDLCRSPLRKTRYVWQLEGKRKIICAKCNNRLEHKASKSAVDALGPTAPRRRH